MHRPLSAVLCFLCFFSFAWASDEPALLEAIRQNPDEDTPRLMYADWVDEQASSESDRARAEFIRLQVDLSRRTDTDSDEYKSRKDRAGVLFRQHSKNWTPRALRDYVAGPVIGKHSSFGGLDHVVWRRGFIERVFVNTPMLRREDVRDAIDSLPALDQLDVATGELDRLLSLRALTRVRGFSMNDLDNASWERIAAKLRNLERLHLGLERLTPAAIAGLVRGPHAETLTTVSFSAGAFQEIGPMMAPLWRTNRLGKLESLGFAGYNPVGAAAWAPPGVLDAKILPALRNLELRNMPLIDIRAFVRHPRFGSIRQLKIENLNDPGPMEALFQEIEEHGTDLIHLEVYRRAVPPSLTAKMEKTRVRLRCEDFVSAFRY